ncbi:hypothetical protein N8T08_009809 [Aspergillus melleus]|uniref:Uncharacterized protein n=1 Tax=Aspergillus melleus TaxID=138277 RepID=A0ACC3ASN8_9EURO|nr:hypothetical protein N8T08_009809 [Aspergillus melleus]
MGLVLVKAPFYNEPSFEAFAEGDNGLIQSMQYTEKTFLTTRKFIQRALEHPVSGMEDVLTWHYLPASTLQDGGNVRPQLLRKAIEEGLKMIEHHNRTAPSDELDETNVVSAFIPRLSLGAVVMLRKHIAALERIKSTQSAHATC